MVCDEYVTDDSGTGVVHQAAAGCRVGCRVKGPRAQQLLVFVIADHDGNVTALGTCCSRLARQYQLQNGL